MFQLYDFRKSNRDHYIHSLEVGVLDLAQTMKDYWGRPARVPLHEDPWMRREHAEALL